MKFTKSFIMKRTWHIARVAAKIFGGKPKDYFSGSLKMSWEFARKASLESNPLKAHMYLFEAWRKEAIALNSRDTSCYTVLGVKFPSTIRDVKKAYKRLALINHPDKGGDHHTFIQVKTAYEQCMKQFSLH
ncbi:DnaJ domain-containing protein [Vibrio fluvialis]|uniref:DnaJ domain-containing protein n=1 Tax=Vibrio fluvialis TaxID=676 RepID=UPI001EEA268F|nr:DnaJ domain-containing protein [Vibrio fluvialis]MCG6368729.1 DnaJ domain-containing protein [Vibrio fluvialis]MCG6377430.1 DnaJ domain-containing protein [Vibrio fluvialis]